MIKNELDEINRLIKLGVVYKGPFYKAYRYGNVYVINPHIIKKGKYLNKNLASLFNDIN